MNEMDLLILEVLEFNIGILQNISEDPNETDVEQLRSCHVQTSLINKVATKMLMCGHYVTIPLTAKELEIMAYFIGQYMSIHGTPQKEALLEQHRIGWVA